MKDAEIDIKWIGAGLDLGSGYGSTVAAGDVTGDGWSELFVGAPFYTPKTSSKGLHISVGRPLHGIKLIFGREL